MPASSAPERIGNDHRQWMQMNSLANQTRIDNIVLNDAQDAQKQPHQKSRERTSVEHRRQRGDHQHQQRSNQRNKLANTGDQTQNQWARQSEQVKPIAQTTPMKRQAVSCARI